jgi:hypothetical protein
VADTTSVERLWFSFIDYDGALASLVGIKMSSFS